ncbi:MAG: TIGR01777 family protein [Puniceicoccaceae bacterium]|nr:MAG: TIGR01777 family protein [Puniceicoccaceae bacterium]
MTEEPTHPSANPIARSGAFHYRRRVRLPVSAAEAYAWHERPGAFARLTPWWEPVGVERATGGIADGAEVVLRVGRWPVRLRWELRHGPNEPGAVFVDRQVRGPFRYYRHEHAFADESGGSGCVLEDRIECGLPGGAVGQWLGGKILRRKFERLFRYRHAITRNDLSCRRRYVSCAAMKVLITGGTGLVGSALQPFLTTQGHEVAVLSRSGGDGRIEWDPEAGRLDATALEGIDAVVHLAGANVADGRWTAAKKKAILESRVQGTRLLMERLGALKQPPRVVVSASGMNFYGDTGDAVVTEDAPPGKGFLADVCRAWEEEAQAAERFGARLVRLRIGLVLSGEGGALAKMLPAFKTGAGGRLGSGQQWVSWVALDDLLGIILAALHDERLTGPVNAVTPHPVRNTEFTETLGEVLHRPAVVPVPAFALKLMFGEMAKEALLASLRLAPARLEAIGHEFAFPELAPALRHALGKDEE